MFSQNSVSALATEFDKLSRIMGAKDVDTTFSGDGAYTNGSAINLPAMDMTAEITPEHQAIMRGYHIHEVSHVTDTDWALTKKRRDKNLHRIWNCCEDVFVERKAMEKYAGARKNLEKTIDHVLGKESEHWAANPQDQAERERTWWEEIPYAALQQARKEMGYESEAIDEYLAGLPKQLAKEAKRWSGKMQDTDDSMEAEKLARTIKRRMSKLGRENDDSEDEEQQQQQQSQTPLQGEGEGESRGEGDGQQDSQTQGDEQGDGDGDGEDGQQQDEAKPEPKGFTLEGAEAREEGAMDEVFGKYNAGQSNFCTQPALIYRDHQGVWDALKTKLEGSNAKKNARARRVIETYHPHAARNKPRQIETCKAAHRDMGSDVRQYSARLARLLMAQEDRRNEGGYASGRIDRRRLAQLVAGNTNVFARPNVTKTSETRIMIAVDGSSSMNEGRTYKAIHAVNDCLGRANVKFDLTEWSGTDFDDDGLGFNPTIVYHKTASERYTKVRDSLVFQPVGGDTPTYAALLSYAQIMSEWQEPRRILLMLTDGEPNGFYRGEPEKVHDLQARMSKAGIEVYAIGIEANDTCMSKMFDKYVMTDFTSLGQTMLGGVEQMLLKNGHAHAA
jgi:cobalamin biosynthesis protein CobT